MSALQAIPTQHGIDILNSELKNTVTKYQLIGALTHDAPSESLYSFHEDTIETSYYDENGVLTFILNLPIEQHFDEYLHQIHVLDNTNQSVIECSTPKVALAKGIGGMVTLKAAISGEAGDVIFKHSEFVTETELVELHLSKYALKALMQDHPYDPNRTYKQNESCITFNAQTGAMERWISYAPSDNKGHDPQEPVNRHEAWANFPTPCWWIKAHGLEPGTPTFWPSNDIPENAMQVMDLDIDATFYHRIAKAHPSLVADGKINLATLLGRYIRIADGVNHLVNTTHEDAIRNLAGALSIASATGFSSSADAEGVFEVGTKTFGNAVSTNPGTTYEMTLDASRAVPTADQNQPVTTMQNYIIWM